MPIKQCVFKGPKNQTLSLPDNKHNRLQKAVIELFRPRYAKGSSLVYLKHSPKNKPVCNIKALAELRVKAGNPKNWPGIILLDKKKKWLFLIEVVTSHGPMTPKRVVELEAIFKKTSLGLILISAFPDFKIYAKCAGAIAWNTDVWIAEVSDHLIHHNGGHLMGPH
jgi:type II restriction enzyme